MGTLRYTPVADLVTALRDKFGVTTLIETGTFQGESTSWAAENFGRVITIDISEQYHAEGKARCEPYKNVLFLLGDSRTALPPAVRALPPGPAIFWLDGHNARQYFGPGPDDCPILEELDAVLGADEGHLILIDDASCFIPPVPHDPAVWPEISAIEAVATKHGYIMRVNHEVIALAPPAAVDELNAFAGDTFVNLLERVENAASAVIDPQDEAHRRRFHINLSRPKISCRATAHIGELPDIQELPDPPKTITEQVKTAYGQMLIPRFDTNQSPSLRGGYALDHAAIGVLIKKLKERPGAIMADVGANVGAFSFGLRPYCSMVHAFEPQRIIYNMLCGSVALNGWTNVYCYCLALSDEVTTIEIPQFDYSRPMSFGSIEFGDEQREKLTQQRQHDPTKAESVQCVPLDYFQFPRLDLLKIDVEGMEFKVLTGANKTILAHRPILFIEHMKVHGPSLRRLLEADYGYELTDTGNDFICTPKA